MALIIKIDGFMASKTQLMHNINYVIVVFGTINPVKEIIAQAKALGVPVLVDGAQGIPHMQIDVQDLDCDFYAFSGHKMFGPTGTGVLFGKESVLDAMPPYKGGGDMILEVCFTGTTYNELPYKFEAGTPIIAGAIGFGYAVDYLSNIGMADVFAHEREITAYAMERLEEVTGVTVIGPPAEHRGGVTAFTVDSIHAHDMAQILDGEGIAVRSGHHCAMPLHDRFNISATARASYYLYNTKAEVDALIDGIYTAKQLFT